MIDPESFTRWGRFVLAAAVVAFGVQNLLCLEPVFGLEPLPAWMPAVALWAVLTGVVLIGCGSGLASGKHAGLAATVLSGFLALWIILLHLPKLIASPGNGSFWTCAFETLAIGSAALPMADGTFLPSTNEGAGGTHRWLMTAGRLGYGVSLPVFGLLHLIYWQYIVSVLPAWLPWPLFWNYFTAAAFFAAGAAVTSGIRARLAATWTGIMFLSWVLMLHGPRVAMNAGSRAEWTSLLVALAMGGGAWVVAHALRETTTLPAPVTPVPDPRTTPLWKQSN